MKSYRCSFIDADRPRSIEIFADDAEDAISVALDRLHEKYQRIEICDDHGLIFFRQLPAHLHGLRHRH